MGSRPRLGHADRFMAAEESVRLLAAAQQLGRDPYRVVRLLLTTGLRASEAARLRVRDCRLKAVPPRCLVVGGKRRDADARDDVLLSPDTARELRRWCHPRASDAFLLRGPLPPTRRWIWHMVKLAVQAAGLNPRFGPHTCRHRFGTDQWLAKPDLEWVRRQMRHRTHRTVVIYMHLADEELTATQNLEAFDALRRHRAEATR